jgi:predicted nuclease of predicted toxin-antitoxin system
MVTSDAPQPSAIKYFLDEHIDPAVAGYLRAHAIEVLTARDAGRANRNISDAEQLGFATAQGRVLVSRDADFLKPREVPQLLSGMFAGIVALRRTVSVGEQARYLRYIAETETMETIAGQIRYFQHIPRGLFDDD